MLEKSMKSLLCGGMIVAMVFCAAANADELWIDFGDHDNSGNPVQAGWNGFVIDGNDMATTHTYGAIDVTLSDTGQPSLQDRLRDGPTNATSITLSHMLRDFVFGDNNNPGEGLNVLIEGLLASQTYQGRIWSHDDSTTAIPDVTFIADWTANGTLIADDYNSGGHAPTTDNQKSFAFEIDTNASGEILFQALRTPESDGSSGVINGLQLENGGVTVMQIDFGNRASTGYPVQDGWSEFTIDGADTATTRSYGAIDVTVSDTGQPALDDRLRSGPANGSNLTLANMLSDFTFGDNNLVGEGMNVLVDGLTPGQTYQGRVWSHDNAAAVSNPTLTFLADWTANGALIADDYNSGGSVPTTDNEKSFAFEIAADANGEILLQALRTPESDGSSGVINGLLLEDTGQTVLQLDFCDHDNGGSPVQEGWNAFTIDGNDMDTTHSYGAVNVTVSDTGQPSLQDRLRDGLDNGTAITLSDVLRDFAISDNNNPGEGLELLIEGLLPNQLYEGKIWSHDDGVTTLPYTFIADWTANGTLIADDYNSGGPAPTTDDEKSFTFQITADANGEILIQALRTPESDGSSGVINGLYLNLVGGITLTPGDANGDGIVNDADAAVLAGNWQTQGGATWGMGDFNDDGNVDDIDATILAANWQTGSSSSASVPEPTAAIMLLAGAIGVACLRSRRKKA